MEFSIQFLLDNDWHRVSAIYDFCEDALIHAKDLLQDGYVVRIIGRSNKSDSKVWYTIKLNSNMQIVLNNSIPTSQL